VAEELPPAILDLIVNTAQWLEGMQTSIASLEELDASILETTDVVATFTEALTAGATDIAIAMDEAAVAMDEAMTSIAAAADEAAAAMERLGVAADSAAASQDAAAVSSKEMAASSAESSSAMGSIADEVGRLAEKAALAVAAVGTTSLIMAGDFQASVTRLVTSAGESSQAIGSLSQGLIDMSTKVGFTANEMAKAMYPIESAGYHAADGLKVMQAAAQGAKDEGADLSHVADAVTTVLRDYNLGADQAADVTSKMVTAISFGKTNFDAFSKSLATVLPIAESVGLSFQDVATVEAAMTAKGTTAQRAAQDVAAAIKSLIAPTTQMTKEFTALGITSDQVQQHLGKDGLAATLEWLRQVAEKNAAAVGQTVPEAMKKLIGTSPGLQAALETTGGAADALSEAIKKVGGATADAQGDVIGFSEVQGNLSFQFDRFKAQLEAVAISIGNMMMPSMIKLLNLLESAFQSMSKNTDIGEGFKAVIDSIGEAFAALKPIFAPLAASFKDLMEVLGPLLVDALKLIAPTLAVNIQAFDDLLKAIKPLLPVIGQMTEVVGKGLGESFKQVWDAIKPLLPEITKLFLAIEKGIIATVPILANFITGIIHTIEWIDKFARKLSDASAAIGRWIEDIPNKIRRMVEEVGRYISDQWNKAMEGLKSTARTTVSNVTSLFTNLPEKIGYALGQIAGTVVRESIKIGVNLENGVKTGAQRVVKFFGSDLPNSILRAMSDAGTWMITTGNDILRGLLDGIKTAATAVVKWFVNLPNVIRNLVSDAYHWLAKTGQDLVQGLIDGIIKKLGDVVNAMTGGSSVKSSVTHPMSDAYNWLVRSGSDIVHGLWSGMVNSFNWLMRNISNFANSVKQGFMDALHINSPSKVMADVVGVGIVEGIAQGMTDNVDIVHRAIGTVKTSILSGFGGVGVTPAGLGIPVGAAGIGLGGAGGGLLVINNNIQGTVVAEKQIREINQTQTLRYNLRNPTNGLSLFGRGSA